jgi:hypothetical protein
VRAVSLLPTATEIVAALGGDALGSSPPSPPTWSSPKRRVRSARSPTTKCNAILDRPGTRLVNAVGTIVAFLRR